MGYKQYNSPFNSYRNPGRIKTNFDIKDLKSMPGVTVPEHESANGTTDASSDDSVKNQNETAENESNITEGINKANREGTADASLGKAGRIQSRIDDPNTPPRKRVKLENAKDRYEHKANFIDEIGGYKNKRKALVRDTKFKNKTAKALEKQQDKFNRQRGKELITDDQLGIKQESYQPVTGEGGYWDKRGDQDKKESTSKPIKGTLEAYENNQDKNDDNEFYTKRGSMGPEMKHVGSRGSAFPMVGPDDITDAARPNRAGGATNKALVNNPINPHLKNAPDKISAQTNARDEQFADIAMDAGTLNTDDNNADQIAKAQSTLGEATNTPLGDGVGSTFGGAPAKKATIDFDGKKVSYDKGGMRENLTSQGVIKSGGKITPQVMREAKKGDFGSKAEKQANFAENRFGFTGTAMRGPSKTMGPHEDPFSMPIPKKTVAQDKSSVKSDRTRKTLHGTKRVIKGTDQHGDKIKMSSKDKKKGRVLKAKF